MMKPSKLKLTVLALAVTALTGCSGLANRVEEDAKVNSEKGTRYARDTGRVQATSKSGESIVYEKSIFIGKAIQKITVEEQLPAIFSESAWFDRSVSSLQEFAERITTRSGVPTKVSQDAILISARAMSSNNTTSGQLPTGMPGVALPPVPTVNGMQGAYGANVQPVRITYPSGNLKGLLDSAASRFGVSWKYQDGYIKFFHMDSKTFSIRAVPGDAILTATVGSTSGSTGTGGSNSSSISGTTNSSSQVATSNSASTQVNSTLSVWRGLQESIAAMISSTGKVVSSPATGTITVTETPDILNVVTEFIETQNALIGKQVMINATILRVSNTEKENFGVSWGLVWSDLSKKYGITNKFATETGSSSFSAAIIDATSKWNGTSLVIDALSQQGTVNLETSASITALNNQPTPVQVANQTTYVAQSSTTTVTNAGTTTSLIPGVVSSGFTMTVLPSVMHDGTIIMQFQSDISALKQIRSITSGGSTIEAPELDTRNFLQRVKMKSGETLIISGFEQTDGNAKRDGVGNPNNWLMGGGIKSSYGKEVMVILLTPVVL